MMELTIIVAVLFWGAILYVLIDIARDRAEEIEKLCV